MNKFLLISALAATLASPAVFAQAKNFEGIGLQISTGYQNNEIKTSNSNINGYSVINGTDVIGAQNVSKGGMPLNLGLGYNLALTDRFMLGAMVEYNPLSMDLGSGSITFNGNPVTDGGYKGKLQNQVSLSLLPGYAFTDSAMGYLKLGWINATAKLEPSDGSSSLSKNANGFLVGLGGRYLFTKNVYGFAEANYATYAGVNANTSLGNNSSDTIGAKMTPSSYSFLLGVGARF